jgi:hypothetical protein
VLGLKYFCAQIKEIKLTIGQTCMICKEMFYLQTDDPDCLSGIPEVAPSLSQQQVMMNDAMLKARKAAELQARIQSQLQRTGLGVPTIRTTLHMPGAAGPISTG